MDLFAKLLQEAEETLLGKLAEDKKKLFLENSISVVSIQNLREEKVKSEGEKGSKKDRRMIRF